MNFRLTTNWIKIRYLWYSHVYCPTVFIVFHCHHSPYNRGTTYLHFTSRFYNLTTDMFIDTDDEVAHQITAVTEVMSVTHMMDMLFMCSIRSDRNLIAPVMYCHINVTLCDKSSCYSQATMKRTIMNFILWRQHQLVLDIWSA